MKKIILIVIFGFLCSLSYNFGYFYGQIDIFKLLTFKDILNSNFLWMTVAILIFLNSFLELTFDIKHLSSLKIFKEYKNKALLLGLVVGIFLLGLMFAIGSIQSLSESKNEANASVYYIGSPEIAHRVTLLRVLNKGLFAKIDEKNTYSIIPNNKIAAIELDQDNHKVFKGILCEWFGKKCSK